MRFAATTGDVVGERGGRGSVFVIVQQQSDFATELGQAIEPLRAGLRKMLAEWGNPRTASTLHRLSSAGQTICWQVFRIVNASDVTAESRHAPTPAALRRLLAAAANAGISAATLDDIRKAAEDFQAFIRDHAADRAAFDSMLAGAAADESGEKILLRHRRAAYRAMSYLWGIQTDLQLISTMVRRSSDGDRLDYLSVVTQQGVRRLRTGTSVTLFGYNKFSNSAAEPDDTGHVAFDPIAEREFGMPIWPEYCSKPLPHIETVEMPSGWILKNLIGEEIGLKANINCTVGYHRHNSPPQVDTAGRRFFYLGFAHFRKPVELLTIDMIVHRDSLPNVRPEMLVYQYQEGDISQEGARRAQQFPLDERITRLGRADNVHHDGVPHYAKMIREAAAVPGWNPSEFDVFRVQIPYPIMGSAVRVFFYLQP